MLSMTSMQGRAKACTVYTIGARASGGPGRAPVGSFQQQGCGLMGRTCNFRIDINALFSFLISNIMFEIGEFMLFWSYS